MIIGFVTHNKTYVMNGLNEFCHTCTISKIQVLEKDNYVIQPKNDVEYDEGYWI